MSEVIRPARDIEAAACRALLPGAFPPAGAAPELLVAAGPDGIRGAAAIAWVPRGFPVLVHVVERWRRRGIGRSLLRAAIEGASGETPMLRAWSPVAEASVAARFLQSAGFGVTRRLLVFESDSARFSVAMTALLHRLRRAGRVGDDMRVVTLAEAPAAGVVRLVAPSFAALPHDVAWRLAPGNPNGYDPALSLVLLRGAAGVGGAMLCRRAGALIDIDVNVVAPELRHGSANLLLLEAMARRARGAGITSCRFACEEHQRDTLNLVWRSEAVQLPSQLVLAFRL